MKLTTDYVVAPYGGGDELAVVVTIREAMLRVRGNRGVGMDKVEVRVIRYLG
jgi:hypothetical protein